jgi:thymidylate synthase
MIDFNLNVVKAHTIAAAWRDAIWLCVKNGVDYKVESSDKVNEAGSYIGQFRRQLSNIMIEIEKPSIMIQPTDVPQSMGMPTSEEAVEQYFLDYLLDDNLKPNEQYRYSTWIAPQLPEIISKLQASNGNTNHAVISVGDTRSCFLSDPPCLRVITFNLVNNELNMTVFFRSWDLICGLPENLYGLQKLKEYILSYLPLGIKDGKMFAYSSGLHIYSQYKDIVNLMCAEKIDFKGGY